MRPSKLRQLFGIAIAIFCLSFIPQQSQAASKQNKPVKSAQPEKEKLVLMPLRVPETDKDLIGAMETALVEGLQQKYVVFSGEQVSQKAREIFMKESRNTAHKECDETKCMQNIAMAFQAELLATANVTKKDGSYFIALSIQNIFDNKVEYSKSTTCKNCDATEVVEKLKELSGTVAPVVATPSASTAAPSVSSGANNAALSISCSGEDTGAEVWVKDKLRGECPVELKVPSGTIKLKLFKAVDAEHERVQELEVKIFEDSVKRVDAKLTLQLTAEGKEEEERKRRELPKGFVSQGGLSWMPINSRKIWPDANTYCTNFAINGLNGWRLPTNDELKALYDSGAMKDQGWTLSYTWSSTHRDSGRHYAVSLSNGNVSSTNDPGDDTDRLYVTCVRQSLGL